MRGGFFLASLALHSVLVGLLLASPSRGVRPARTLSLTDQQRIVYTALVKESVKVKRSQSAKAQVAMPKKAASVPQKPAKVAKAEKKPKPVPTPPEASTSISPEEKVAALKKIPYFSEWSEEDLKKLELPPGVKDWGQVAAITDMLDQSNWVGTPPELEHSASRSALADANPLTALADMLASFTEKDYVGSQLFSQNGQSVMVFQYMDMMFVARWKQGDSKAKVTYFPHGGQEVPDKAFEIPVEAASDPKEQESVMTANIILGYQTLGMPR